MFYELFVIAVIAVIGVIGVIAVIALFSVSVIVVAAIADGCVLLLNKSWQTNCLVWRGDIFLASWYIT